MGVEEPRHREAPAEPPDLGVAADPLSDDVVRSYIGNPSRADRDTARNRFAAGRGENLNAKQYEVRSRRVRHESPNQPIAPC